ncbi:cystathionine beta-lyase [Qipengyuania sediminis]|uniref:cystathionine beta-lyase n=1 Tax=Qipengyuania sediminis TaxID=1532023 RepID=UPI00105A0DAD|nr:cystathionine beta-lyase [Qipengyuania sediminis]
MVSPRDDLDPATLLIARGRSNDPHVVNPPVYRASTHLSASCAELAASAARNADGAFFYGRRGAPTQWALAEALTALEPGAAGTVLYPSGVAAIAGALLAACRPGDVLLVTDNAYEPSRAMATGLLKRLGVEARFFDPLDAAGFAARFCDRTAAVLLESPGSLTMEVADVPALAATAREKAAAVLIDATWPSPLGLHSLAHGCDIVIQSLTKHVGGHSDLMMGACSAGPDWYPRLRTVAQELGQVVSPDDAALALRGLRTMAVRLERESAGALIVAEWLAAQPEVAEVRCPMLPGATGHALWRRDFIGGCGLFSFVLAPGIDQEARARLIDALELFGIGYSWGGFESLALPIDPHRIRTGAPWPAGQLAVRLSIGLEDPGDLIADLARGFAAMRER